MSVTRGQCDARPTVTFPAARHHRPLAGTKLYCLVSETHATDRRLTDVRQKHRLIPPPIRGGGIIMISVPSAQGCTRQRSGVIPTCDLLISTLWAWINDNVHCNVLMFCSKQ